MRTTWILALIAGALSCTPDIGTGTYFCGPEQFCPPKLQCDGSSHTCVSPVLVEPFACPEGSDSAEPDDDLGSAHDLGMLTLNEPAVLTSYSGCIPGPEDADLVELECSAVCADGDGVLKVTLRYPIAFLPLQVELLDQSGNPVVGGELCTPAVDYTGMDYSCISHAPTVGTFYLRTSAVAGAPDCGGECAFNRYSLDIKFMR